MVQNPPFGGGKVVVRGGVVAVQGGVRAQSADHLGEKRRQWGVVGEVVCVLGKTVSDMVCCSHANPLLRALTGYFARKPAIPCLGGAAHAHISGLTCALADPRSH